MMRIDPFLGSANRSVAIYETLNKTLDYLLERTGKDKVRGLLNYTRLKEHFSTFAAMIGIDHDVRNVLLEMCHELEGISNNDNSDTRRRSILDP